MSNDDQLHDALRRASRAQDLLRSELLIEAFKTLEDSYTAAWRASTVDQVNAREKLFLAINIVGKVRDHLTNVVQNGKLAQAELQQLIDTAERKKRFGII